MASLLPARVDAQNAELTGVTCIQSAIDRHTLITVGQHVATLVEWAEIRIPPFLVDYHGILFRQKNYVVFVLVRGK